jgi:hypothetical protein
MTGKRMTALNKKAADAESMRCYRALADAISAIVKELNLDPVRVAACLAILCYETMQLQRENKALSDAQFMAWVEDIAKLQAGTLEKLSGKVLGKNK